MASTTTDINDVKENADIDRETPQPAIHVEERKLSRHDFLKTVVKSNGSDLHLQSGSVPMIRVDILGIFPDLYGLVAQVLLACTPFVYRAVRKGDSGRTASESAA